MRCPKDANRNSKLNKNLNDWCLKVSPDFGLVCTRFKNHRDYIMLMPFLIVSASKHGVIK